MNIKMKATNNINLSLLGTVLLASCLFTSAGAAPLTVTNTFEHGKVLTADELNTNFGEVEAAVNGITSMPSGAAPGDMLYWGRIGMVVNTCAACVALY